MDDLAARCPGGPPEIVAVCLVMGLTREDAGDRGLRDPEPLLANVRDVIFQGKLQPIRQIGRPTEIGKRPLLAQQQQFVGDALLRWGEFGSG
jgi:hypothetical protein